MSKKEFTTDVHISLAEAQEKGLLFKTQKQTNYFNYEFWVRSHDEVRYNISQNITTKAQGGEYFSPLFKEGWNEDNRIFDIEELNQEDVWLDAGAHTGIFATRLLTQFPKIKKVIGYEPFENNQEFAVLNTQANGVGDRYEAQTKALVADDTKEIDFYLAWDSGKHSALPIKGRTKTTVEAQNFKEALKEATCLKMDIEGLEGELLRSVDDWSNIRVALIEYHFHYRSLSHNREAQFLDIIDRFKKAGFDVWYKPGVETTKTWITHFACVKKK
jgi:FkbM family methyltransferase